MHFHLTSASEKKQRIPYQIPPCPARQPEPVATSRYDVNLMRSKQNNDDDDDADGDDDYDDDDDHYHGDDDDNDNDGGRGISPNTSQQ